MAKGRPVGSQIRQNIVELLYFMKEGYGYQIYKTYLKLFPRCTLRSIHYHLKKGLLINEFKIKEIKKEKGEFSWGATAEKIYYELGPSASPKIDERIKRFFDRKE